MYVEYIQYLPRISQAQTTTPAARTRASKNHPPTTTLQVFPALYLHRTCLDFLLPTFFFFSFHPSVSNPPRGGVYILYFTAQIEPGLPEYVLSGTMHSTRAHMSIPRVRTVDG